MQASTKLESPGAWSDEEEMRFHPLSSLVTLKWYRLGQIAFCGTLEIVQIDW
jgi:hypothetical protein